ncbi:hypothetical protein VFPPC_00817 [Pochonia chlamydosporia 170]|uniref:Uncharacterized protein n=1 Tax=Pochonia chlamydosporia 170 TaxID=1380566 RepID=A0A179G588_METCM|nr:hypothetical protein VFPPC_00817 [Pochonia chlamydosporia 170]OAQ72997.1 hypothetical protein VFPPC_00817 [Pochonia chlamydosporia 170]
MESCQCQPPVQGELSPLGPSRLILRGEGVKPCPAVNQAICLLFLSSPATPRWPQIFYHLGRRFCLKAQIGACVSCFIPYPVIINTAANTCPHIPRRLPLVVINVHAAQPVAQGTPKLISSAPKQKSQSSQNYSKTCPKCQEPAASQCRITNPVVMGSRPLIISFVAESQPVVQPMSVGGGCNFACPSWWFHRDALLVRRSDGRQQRGMRRPRGMRGFGKLRVGIGIGTARVGFLCLRRM